MGGNQLPAVERNYKHPIISSSTSQLLAVIFHSVLGHLGSLWLFIFIFSKDLLLGSKSASQFQVKTILKGTFIATPVIYSVANNK